MLVTDILVWCSQLAVIKVWKSLVFCGWATKIRFWPLASVQLVSASFMYLIR